jgi:transcriptional regulator with XRE-family HTH domain
MPGQLVPILYRNSPPTAKNLHDLAQILPNPIESQTVRALNISVPNFGSTVRSIIQQRHMTLRQIAAAAHLSLDTINRILKMEKPSVNPTTFCSLAQGLGLTPAELDAYLHEPKPVTSLTPEQAAALLQRSGSIPGRSEADQCANLRRQIHAITDLLALEGLKRLHSLAQQELRQQVNQAQNGGGNPGAGPGGSPGLPGQTGARRAAKPAGPRTHAVTRVANAADLRLDSHGAR